MFCTLKCITFYTFSTFSIFSFFYISGIHPQCQNHPKSKIQIQVFSYLLADDQSQNLLILAASDGRLELVKYLLEICDMNNFVRGKLAIDFAFSKNQCETVFLLLNENSRFPQDFKVADSMTDELLSFVDSSKKLHSAIESHDLVMVEEIVDKNSNLKFLYSTENVSALSAALTSGAFEIYKLLMTKNVTFGPHEIFEDLLEQLSESQKEELTAINESMLQCVGDKHILMLMSNIQVGADDKQKRLSLVCDALQKLNTIPGINILLQTVAATRKFQLIFDFNREHILFLQPAEEGYVTGLFDICGRIYVGAKDLLNPSKAHEVLGVIAHELCHYVMWIVYKNTAKPYQAGDETKTTRFNQILEFCKENSHLEEIVGLVFSQYEDDMHVAELIVRVPHALGHYIDDPQKFEEFNENFKDLNVYYEEVVGEIQEKLPKIEKEVENQIRKDNSSPLNFVKYHWRKILLGLILIAFASFLITLTARSCLFKTCSDPNSSCEFEQFKATCKCSKNLYMSDDKCFQCLSDDHCYRNQSCYLNTCYSDKNVFTCRDKTKLRMFSSKRCDGHVDCVDGSDETYHCSKLEIFF